MSNELQVTGPQWGGQGTFKPQTASISGSQRGNNAHGNFFDSVHNSRLFVGGGTIVSIANVTFTIATTGATATPIIGLYNPPSSPVNLSVLRASLAVIVTALQATGPGGFVWASSIGNLAVSTGNPGFNAKTLQQAGAYGKFFNGGAALTGLTNALVALRGSALGGGSYSNAALLGTAVGFQTQQVTSEEYVDGGINVPPGGVLALLATTTPVAHSTVPGIIWEENPLIV